MQSPDTVARVYSTSWYARVEWDREDRRTESLIIRRDFSVGGFLGDNWDQDGMGWDGPGRMIALSLYIYLQLRFPGDYIVMFVVSQQYSMSSSAACFRWNIQPIRGGRLAILLEYLFWISIIPVCHVSNWVSACPLCVLILIISIY